jgi:fermentation-respiration switch protein FrsA (DUF1100 family)
MSLGIPTHDPEHPPILSMRPPSLAWRFCRTLLLGYLLVCLMLAFLERHLVYLPPPAISDFAEIRRLGGEEVWLEADDGTRLHGWFFAHEQPKLALLYAYGNAEDAERNAEWMAELRDSLGASVLIVNYRGYGHSEGTPSEPGLIADGMAAQRWLAERMQIEPSGVVLYGRSIGGGVVVALAGELGARAVVAHNTFANMVDVAAQHYSFLPVRLLMRNRFPSEERIKHYDGPLLQIHGTADSIVPLELAQPLFDASPSKHKRFVLETDGGHNDPLSPSAYRALVDFLHGLPE